MTLLKGLNVRNVQPDTRQQNMKTYAVQIALIQAAELMDAPIQAAELMDALIQAAESMDAVIQTAQPIIEILTVLRETNSSIKDMLPERMDGILPVIKLRTAERETMIRISEASTITIQRA